MRRRWACSESESPRAKLGNFDESSIRCQRVSLISLVCFRHRGKSSQPRFTSAGLVSVCQPEQMQPLPDPCHKWRISVLRLPDRSQPGGRGSSKFQHVGARPGAPCVISVIAAAAPPRLPSARGGGPPGSCASAWPRYRKSARGSPTRCAATDGAIEDRLR